MLIVNVLELSQYELNQNDKFCEVESMAVDTTFILPVLMYFNFDWFHDNDVKFVELRTYLTPCVCYKVLFLLQHERRFWYLFFDAQINTVKYKYFCETMAAIMASAIEHVI